MTSGKYHLHTPLHLNAKMNGDRVKKAYRRKALELHPDRNYGDTDRTTKLFAEVQSAYEVLSDTQERAWYDSHEDAILRDMDSGNANGVDGQKRGQYEHSVGFTTADDITRMIRKFHGNVEFTDGPLGFFGFLRETFERLAKEEQVAARNDGDDITEYPLFGHEDDNYEDVVRPFYNTWTGFATKKSFAWRDKYRTADANDRRMRRLMEKENKRFRGEAILEYNDAVRSLVAFVRKRDPRYRPNMQSEAERQQVLRDVAKAQAARMRAANAERVKQEVPEWVKVREPDEIEEESDEESDEEHFECVACKKTFKSEKQYEAHENSKKHMKAVQTLRRRLQKEGHTLDYNNDGVNDITQEVQENDERKEVESELHQVNDQVNDTALPEQERSDTTQSQSVDMSAIADTAKSRLGKVYSDSIPSKDLSPIAGTESDSDTDPERDPNGSAPDTVKSEPDLTSGATSTKPKQGKAAQKRAKKAAKQSSVDQGDLIFRCALCNAIFPSRTRMFQHVKDFGHAAPVSKSTKGPKGKKQ